MLFQNQDGKDVQNSLKPFVKSVTVDDVQYKLRFTDIVCDPLEVNAGPDFVSSCIRRRPLDYALSSVLLVCFAYDDRASFDAVKKWIDELTNKHVDETTPFVLVGLKADCTRKVSEDDIKNCLLHNKRFADEFYPVSCKTDHGVKELLLAVSKIAVKHHSKSQVTKGGSEKNNSNRNTNRDANPKERRGGCNLF